MSANSVRESDFAEQYPHVYAAFKYADDVLEGRIPACKTLIAACERFFSDLDKSETDDFPYWFDQDTAEEYAQKFEKYPHVKGKWARDRELFKLSPYQNFAVVNVFGWLWHPEIVKHPIRRFNELSLYVPRKNGKSTFGAILGNVMGFEDNEFGAEVYSGATSEKQAFEIFRPARAMARRVFPERDFDVLTKSIVCYSDESRFEPLVGNPGDGSSPHCALVDEYHEHATDDLYETMNTGMGAREQPLLAVLTTAGKSIGGPCHLHYKDCKRVLEGAMKADRHFILIFEADDPDNWDDPKEFEKANPNIDISISRIKLLGELDKARRSPRYQNAYKTKHLNVWVGSASAWLPHDKWQACAHDITLEQFRGRKCYIAIDLASQIDLASIGFVFYDNFPEVEVFELTFCPEARVKGHEQYETFVKEGELIPVPGEKIDYELIEDKIAEIADEYRIEMMGYDPWQAEYLAKRLEAKGGLSIVRFRQNYANYHEPMRHFEAGVISGSLKHSGSKLLTWAVNNVRIRMNHFDEMMPTKDHPGSEEAIDPLVAIIMAYSVMLKEQQLKMPSYFEGLHAEKGESDEPELETASVRESDYEDDDPWDDVY